MAKMRREITNSNSAFRKSDWTMEGPQTCAELRSGLAIGGRKRNL
jgi:hypothetical protein